MKNVKKEGLFSQAVPSVYIDSIIIENAAVPKHVNDPHIKDPFTEPELISGLSLRDRIFVKVNIAMKDSGNHLFSSLLKSGDLEKYLMVAVVQSQEEGITPEQLPSLIESFGEDTARFIRVINVSDGIHGREDTYDILDDGTKIHTIDFQQTFSVELPSGDSNPSYLAYHAMCYVDMESFFRDYELVRDSSTPSMNGKISSEIVFQDAKLVSKSYLFKTSDGMIWPGLVIKNEDGTYKTPSPSEPIYPEEVANRTVQDNRIFRTIGINHGDLLQNVIDAENLSISKNVFSSQKSVMADRKKEKYISDITFSKNPDGSLAFLFDVNLKRLLEVQSPYGKIISNLSSAGQPLDEIYLLSKITKADVIRYPANKGIDGKPVIDNKNKKTPFTVASLNKNLLKADISLERQKVKYTGTDRTMSSITNGKYAYRVDLDIVDGVSAYMNRLYSELVISNKMLEDYALSIQMPSMSEDSNISDDPHTYQASEEIRNRDSKKSNNVNRATGKLSSRFRREIKQKYADSEDTPWNTPAALLEEVCYGLYSNETLRNLSIGSSFQSSLHPDSATIGSVLSFIQLYEFITEQVKRIVSQATGTSEDKGQTTYKKSSESNIIKADKLFNKIYSANTPDRVGYDYLSVRSPSVGITKIYLSDWNRRVDAENNKWFSDATSFYLPSTSSIPKRVEVSNNDYSYLSPSQIYLSSSPQSTSVLDDEVYDVIYNKIYSYNSHEDSTFEKRSVQNSSLASSFYKMGASFFNPSERDRILSPPSAAVITELEGSSRVIKKNNFDIVDRIYDRVNIQESVGALEVSSGEELFLKHYSYKDSSAGNINFYNLSSRDNVIRKMKEKEITSLPNQILSIVASSNSPEVTSYQFFNSGSFESRIDKTNSPLFQLNINSLMRVEYHSGTQGWRLLTRDVLSSLPDLKILCKLVPYDNERLHVYRNKKLDLPIYNEYFILDLGNVVAPAEVTAVPIRRGILDKLKTVSGVDVPSEFSTTSPLIDRSRGISIGRVIL